MNYELWIDMKYLLLLRLDLRNDIIYLIIFINKLINIYHKLN